MNSLRAIFERFHLSPRTVAKMTGLAESRIEAAINESPSGPLETYLSLMSQMGFHVRVPMEESLRFWFRVSAIDELARQDGWRKKRGWLPWPKNRGDLFELIRSFRHGRVEYKKIADTLEENWIPTMTGLRSWHKATVYSMFGKKHYAWVAAKPLPRDKKFIADFRALVADELKAELCPYDPFAQIRYDIKVGVSDGLLWITGDRPVPHVMRKWSHEAIERLGWFAVGDWGSRVPDAASDGADANEQLGCSDKNNPGNAKYNSLADPVDVELGVLLADGEDGEPRKNDCCNSG